MSEINITRKVFLEREELMRLQEFLRDDIARNAIIGNTRQFGIIQTEFVANDTNFQVSQGTAAGTIQFTKERSQALDIDGDLIRLAATDNIAVTDDSNWYWVRISHVFRRHEVGTVSVNTNGQLTGISTLFNDVLRGQATDVPVRIRFQQTDGTAAVNNGTYEVVDVTDNTNALLTSVVGFQAESNLNYIVVGTTPVGEVISTEQLTGLYQYDSCLVELIQETATDTPPALPANGANRYFYVARVMNNSGTVSVQDKRDIDDTYWKFNVPGVNGAIINRPIGAPPDTEQYALLGSIPNTVSQFAHFLFVGAGAIQGYIAFIRLNHVNPVGLNVISAQVTIVRDAENNAMNPVFYTRVNTTDNVIELWLRSPTERIAPGAELMPGVISLLSESIGAGGGNWRYADSFTWSATVPSNITLATAVGNVYSRAGTNLDYDLTINTLSTRVNELRSDSLWVNLTPVTGNLNVAASRAWGRQRGNVVTLCFLFRRNATPTGAGAATLYNLPSTIAPPAGTPGDNSIPFTVVDGSSPYAPHAMRIGLNGAIFVTDIMDLLENSVYEGSVTYLV